MAITRPMRPLEIHDPFTPWRAAKSERKPRPSWPPSSAVGRLPTLVCRHLSLIPPPLKGGRYVCGNLLPGNVCGRYRPCLGGWQRLWDSALEGGKLKQLAKLALQRDGRGGKDLPLRATVRSAKVRGPKVH